MLYEYIVECPSGYVVGKSASGRQDGYCLLFVDSFNTWYDAMMDCESRGGVLPDVNDAELQNQLFNLSSTRCESFVVMTLFRLYLTGQNWQHILTRLTAISYCSMHEHYGKNYLCNQILHFLP